MNKFLIRLDTYHLAICSKIYSLFIQIANLFEQIIVYCVLRCFWHVHKIQHLSNVQYVYNLAICVTYKFKRSTTTWTQLVKHKHMMCYIAAIDIYRPSGQISFYIEKCLR